MGNHRTTYLNTAIACTPAGYYCVNLLEDLLLHMKMLK